MSSNFFSYFHYYFTFLASYFLFIEILYFPKMPLYFQNDITWKTTTALFDKSEIPFKESIMSSLIRII